MKDGVTRHYTGSRGLQDLLNYIRKREWQSVQPVPWYKSPDSIPYVLSQITVKLRYNKSLGT